MPRNQTTSFAFSFPSLLFAWQFQLEAGLHVRGAFLGRSGTASDEESVPAGTAAAATAAAITGIQTGIESLSLSSSADQGPREEPVPRESFDAGAEPEEDRFIEQASGRGSGRSGGSTPRRGRGPNEGEDGSGGPDGEDSESDGGGSSSVSGDWMTLSQIQRPDAIDAGFVVLQAGTNWTRTTSVEENASAENRTINLSEHHQRIPEGGAGSGAQGMLLLGNPGMRMGGESPRPQRRALSACETVESNDISASDLNSSGSKGSRNNLRDLEGLIEGEEAESVTVTVSDDPVARTLPGVALAAGAKAAGEDLEGGEGDDQDEEEQAARTSGRGREEATQPPLAFVVEAEKPVTASRDAENEIEMRAIGIATPPEEHETGNTGIGRALCSSCAHGPDEGNRTSGTAAVEVEDAAGGPTMSSTAGTVVDQQGTSPRVVENSSSSLPTPETQIDKGVITACESTPKDFLVARTPLTRCGSGSSSGDWSSSADEEDGTSAINGNGAADSRSPTPMYAEFSHEPAYHYWQQYVNAYSAAHEGRPTPKGAPDIGFLSSPTPPTATVVPEPGGPDAAASSRATAPQPQEPQPNFSTAFLAPQPGALKNDDKATSVASAAHFLLHNLNLAAGGAANSGEWTSGAELHEAATAGPAYGGGCCVGPSYQILLKTASNYTSGNYARAGAAPADTELEDMEAGRVVHAHPFSHSPNSPQKQQIHHPVIAARGNGSGTISRNTYVGAAAPAPAAPDPRDWDCTNCWRTLCELICGRGGEHRDRVDRKHE